MRCYSLLLLLLSIATINLDVIEAHLTNYSDVKASDYVQLNSSSSTVSLKLKNNQTILANRKLVNIGNGNGSVVIIYELLGVPFAQAPLDEKRFQFPFNLSTALPSKNYNATFMRAACMQERDETFGDFSGSQMWNTPGNVSEDCLYMNIWVPVNPLLDQMFMKSSETTAKGGGGGGSSSGSICLSNLTTMVWIYGGSFNTGTANLNVYNGILIAALQNVIVVAPNYRVGPFGFLYLNSKSAPGNAGLADQLLAIKWYKEWYMPLFAAQNSTVALFGESAGAMSIHALLLSDESSYLFQRVILESSSAYLSLAYRNQAESLALTYQFAAAVNCLPSNNSSQAAATAVCPNNLNFISSLLKQNESSICFLQDEIYENQILNCLLSVDASTLSVSQYAVDYVNTFLPMQFVMTQDFNGLLKVEPSSFDFEFSAAKERQLKFNKELLIGINQDEGTYFALYAFLSGEKYFNLTNFFQGNFTYDNAFVADRLHEAMNTKYADAELNIQQADNKNNNNNNNNSSSTLQQSINSIYYGKYMKCLSEIYDYQINARNSSQTFNLNSRTNRMANSAELAWLKVSKILGDFHFSCPSLELATRYSAVRPNKTFFYKFNRRAASNPWPQWMGVMHGYEIEYLFGMPYLNPAAYTDDDRMISMRLMNYFANFAKYGKLVSDLDEYNVERYLDISLATTNISYDGEYNEVSLMNEFQAQFQMCDLVTKLTAKDSQNYYNAASFATKYETCLIALANLSNRSYINHGDDDHQIDLINRRQGRNFILINNCRSNFSTFSMIKSNNYLMRFVFFFLFVVFVHSV